MRAATSTLGAVVAAVVFAACGGGTSQAPRSAASEWGANAAGIIDQLRADAVAASDGDSISSARAALRDESRLYGLLVAYSDFGGCRHMVGAVGRPPLPFRRVGVTLARACANLQSAAALFTRAASRSNAPALVAATRAVAVAAPLLEHAELELRTATLRR
jgi:hypothetical protein